MPRILVFTKTTGYRHESIEAGVARSANWPPESGLDLDHSEDAADFAEQNLARYAATVWLDVSGDVLDAEQRAAFAAYLRGGRRVRRDPLRPPDAEWSWPEYEQILGARFLSHPNGPLQFQRARLNVVDASHPSTHRLPDPWWWTDEWYVFSSNPSERVERAARGRRVHVRPGRRADAVHGIRSAGTAASARVAPGTRRSATGTEMFADPIVSRAPVRRDHLGAALGRHRELAVWSSARANLRAWKS